MPLPRNSAVALDRPGDPSRRARSAWLITLAATAASTYALDAVATAAGVLLVAPSCWAGSTTPSRSPSWPRRTCCGASPCGRTWAPTGAAAPDGNQHQRAVEGGVRAHGAPGTEPQRIAAATGYVATEMAKEAPYYAGAFGAAASPTRSRPPTRCSSSAGANLGAAAYEYGLARLTRGSFSPPRVRVVRHRLGAAGLPGRLLPRRRAGRARTIAYFADAMKDAAVGEPILVFGTGPTLASRLPRRAQGLGDPPRRLPAREPRGDRALAHARPCRPRLARLRPLHTAMRGLRAPTEERRHAARGAHARSKITRLLQADARRPAHSTGITRRSSAPIARTRRPTIAPHGRR